MKIYKASTGEVINRPEPEFIQPTNQQPVTPQEPRPASEPYQPPPPPPHKQNQGKSKGGQSSGLGSLVGSIFGGGKKQENPLGALGGGIGGILNKLRPENLETEDILLLLILYFLYRESGDEELLIIMALMFLL